ncbi:MAG TPA: hypothetical protein VIW46_10900, partial [Acidimicrobiia bacterium]
MAAAGWMVAPDPWPSGEAVLTIELGGSTALEERVELGPSDSIALQSGATLIEFAEGIPVDRPIEATISAPTDDPGSVLISLEVADGRTQRIPILRYDEGTGTFTASRRPPAGVGPTLALLGFVVVMWVSEAIPLFVTSLLIPVVIVVTGSGSARDALAPFFHPIIALFFGGFLMAEAM